MDTPTVAKGIKALVGRKRTKSIKFLDVDINITKLTVAEVKQIQEAAKPLETDEENDDAGLNILRTVIRAAVEGGEELVDSDFEAWPIDDLRELSKTIMEFSGIAQSTEGN
jgi:hypothetical protein